METFSIFQIFTVASFGVGLVPMNSSWRYACLRFIVLVYCVSRGVLWMGFILPAEAGMRYDFWETKKNLYSVTNCFSDGKSCQVYFEYDAQLEIVFLKSCNSLEAVRIMCNHRGGGVSK